MFDFALLPSWQVLLFIRLVLSSPPDGLFLFLEKRNKTERSELTEGNYVAVPRCHDGSSFLQFATRTTTRESGMSWGMRTDLTLATCAGICR